jgi:hypothetical protein
LRPHCDRLAQIAVVSITGEVIDLTPVAGEGGASFMQMESAMNFLRHPNLLRYILAADALATGATALLLVAGAGLLAGLLGLPVELLRYAGLLLIPFVAFVTYTAMHVPIARGSVWMIVALNAAWVIASVALLVSGLVVPTVLGYVFVLMQALAVAVFAELQLVGLRRSAMAA